MRNRRKQRIIIGTLCAIIAGMVVGYAALNQVLNINGTSNITSNWNIKITNISVQEKSSGASDISGPTYDNTNGLTASFNTNFTKPGDYETYKIEITNSGEFNAELSNIVAPTSSNPDIIFYVNKDENNVDIAGALTQNSVLNKSGEIGNVGYVYVTVLYRSYDNQQLPSDSNRTATATIKFDFTQTSKSASETPSGPTLKTVYAYHTDEKTIGTSILAEPEYVTDYTQLDSYKAGTPLFIKYDIDETGLIQSAYACQKFSFIDDPVCMQGGSADYYSTNKSILEGLKPTFENDSGSCSFDSFDLGHYYSNCWSDYFSVTTGSDGRVATYSSSIGCLVYDDGRAFCGREE